MTGECRWLRAAKIALARLLLAALLLLPGGMAFADERAQVMATSENGYGRIVLTFPGRLNLPPYKVRYDNGVLAIKFEQPVDFVLPDVAALMQDYVTVARVDPDRKGLRVGLRSKVNLNRTEAGEKLYVDILPPNWQGPPPSLPAEVISDMAERARIAAAAEEEQRKAEQARLLSPVVKVRVGRNPTFMRIQFDWSVATEAEFTLDGTTTLDFDWPVPIDVSALANDLPPELLGAESSVNPKGSRVTFKLASGVVPRFYKASDREFIVDIDLAHEQVGELRTIEELAKLVPAASATQPKPQEPETPAADAAPTDQTEITPTVNSIGQTVRLTFPFDRDTAAAVFRRGNTVWMMFDTGVRINQPASNAALAAISTGVSISAAGDTQIVRLDLSTDRLATLGSEGRSWVLSLGDVLLNPTEALPLGRRRDTAGEFEMVADMQRPAVIHQFRDPQVGDVLTVVSAFPPARGVSRSLSYVDFAALPSIQGLVIRPEHDGLEVEIENRQAVIRTAGGLTLSPIENARAADTSLSLKQRSTFVDLADGREEDGFKFIRKREDLVSMAAEADGSERDAARLELARFYLANQFAQEAVGVLDVTLAEMKDEAIRKKARLSLGIALTLAHRPDEAVAILGGPGLGEEPDATMWRAIARTDQDDFAGARLDALSAEAVIENYPRWVRNRFLFAGVRAAVETNDFVLAQHFLSLLEFAKLDPEQVTWFQFFTARIAEANNRDDEALDGYGQVIAADVRPSRVEAVYRTLVVLDHVGRLDLPKATATLSAEALLWRGDRLESEMQQFLADLYFRHKDYRLGFETVKQAGQHFPESPSSDALLARAQSVFSMLYLDGGADALPPVDALSLYYDFRELTPPGARGDEMIRNLARRLVEVDLLAQAGDLLEYQVTSRLKGAAQAQVAADLAAIRLADRNPEAALSALNRSRISNLPPDLERQRRVLEARALIDADRQDLALDLLRTMTGKDADMLRIDGMWKSKQYQAASELMEVTYAPEHPGDPMTQPERMSILKAGVGFVLAGDQLGVSRLRSKFGDAMSKTPEWPLFDFVTGSVSADSPEFRKLAREVSGLDSLDSFLAAYRQLYGKGGEPLPSKSASVAG